MLLVIMHQEHPLLCERSYGGVSRPTPKSLIRTTSTKFKGTKVGTLTWIMHIGTTTQADITTEIGDKIEMVIGFAWKWSIYATT